MHKYTHINIQDELYNLHRVYIIMIRQFMIKK